MSKAQIWINKDREDLINVHQDLAGTTQLIYFANLQK